MLYKLLLPFVGLLAIAGIRWGIRMAEIDIPHPPSCYSWPSGEKLDESVIDSLVAQYFEQLPEPQRCPFCGGSVVPCYFQLGDMPEFDYDEYGRQRRVCLGCVYDGSSWFCLHCKHRYKLKVSMMIVARRRYPFLFKRYLDNLPPVDSLDRIPYRFLSCLSDKRREEIIDMILDSHHAD